MDPRQGRLFDAGANYFIMDVKPRLLVPMHFWNRPEIPIEYARRARCRDTEVIALTRIGERMRLDVDEQGYMTVNLLAMPEPAPQMSYAVDLNSYEKEDPFVDTDMPVDLEEEPEELEDMTEEK